MFSTVLAVAAVAGSLVSAAPLQARAIPKTYDQTYLEQYDVYHLRYLALDCQDQHNTVFFDDCCHPLLAGEDLSSRPAQCTPNTTEIAEASAYISSTAAYGVPKTSATASSTASVTVDWEADGYPSAAVVASSAAASSAAASATTSAYVAAAAPIETSSTTTTTKAKPSTTTTQAAQTTSAASSGGNGGSTQTGGFATYFYQGGNAGACGNYNSDSAHIVAIDSAWWPNFGSQSQYCGRSLTIQNTNNGKTTTATVADVCPTCVNGNSLDLSVGAFTAIASESDGMVPITWWWN